jgi:enoyl-CoA hydratase/carnithine racemase
VSVKFHIEDRLAVVTLARPHCLNAISSDLLDALLSSLQKAEASIADVVLLEAEGRAFCAGDDLTELGSSTPTLPYAQHFVARLQDVTRQIMFGTKIVVCAAQGYMVGGGAAWPLNADFSIISDDAVLFCPEVGYGMFPSGGATFLLEARCGSTRAAEILWRAKRVNAVELLEDGIVGSCVPRGELSLTARALANSLADLPASSRLRIKQQRILSKRDQTEAAMTLEAEYCIAAALDPLVQKSVMETHTK